MSTTDWTTLLDFLLPILAAVITVIVKDWQNNQSTNRQDKIRMLVEDSVAAIEQTMATADGTTKKARALALVTSLLKKSNLPVDPSVISTLIEAAVYHLPKSPQPQHPDPTHPQPSTN